MRGDSYYGNSGATNLNVNRAPAAAPSGLAHADLPRNLEDNSTEFNLQFVLPDKRQGTLEDGQSDDVYGIDVTVPAAVNGEHLPGAVEILLNGDLTAVLAPGDRITFGAVPASRYVVQAIAVDRVYLEYGLAETVADADPLNKMIWQAECPATLRTFRINTTIGQSITVRALESDRYHNWVVPVVAGSGEDRNNAVVTITPFLETWVKTAVVDITPAPVVLAAAAALGSLTITASFPAMETIVTPGDRLSLGLDSSDFYEVDGASGATVTFTTPLLAGYAAGTAVFRKVTFPYNRYDTAPLSEFGAQWAFGFATEASALNLYYSEVPQAQGTPGTKIEISPSDAGLTIGAAGQASTLTLNRTGQYFRGRKLYWGISVSDLGLTPNESAKDLNAWATSEPGQPVSGSIDDTEITDIVIGYGPITVGGANPSFYAAMGGAGMTQYSKIGGYDVFVKEATPLTLTGGGGYYRAGSSSDGVIVHSALQVGDFVKIINGATHNLWLGRVTYPGQVTFSAANLRYGTNPTDYMNLSQSNFSVSKATIDPLLDSILPLSDDPIPEKQYVTEAVTSVHYTGAQFGKDYVAVMQAVDTTCDKGKL